MDKIEVHLDIRAASDPEGNAIMVKCDGLLVRRLSADQADELAGLLSNAARQQRNIAHAAHPGSEPF